MVKDRKYHYVTAGDSLGLTPTKFACGQNNEGAVGYMEVEKVTCVACRQTKAFKEAWEELEHDRVVEELFAAEGGTIPDNLDIDGAKVVGVLTKFPNEIMAVMLEKDDRRYWLEASKFQRAMH